MFITSFFFSSSALTLPLFVWDYFDIKQQVNGNNENLYLEVDDIKIYYPSLPDQSTFA